MQNENAKNKTACHTYGILLVGVWYCAWHAFCMAIAIVWPSECVTTLAGMRNARVWFLFASALSDDALRAGTHSPTIWPFE